MHARSYAMNYSYYYVFIRNYTYTERFTESMRSKTRDFNDVGGSGISAVAALKA